MRMRLVLFPKSAAAIPLRDQLIKAGIRAEIHDELQLERLWFVSKSAAGVRLEVPTDAWARSLELLRDWDAATGALREAIRCPECKSLRVQYPQLTQKSFLTNLVIGLIAELGLVERQYYCEDCHCMWPRQQARPHRSRSHLAPNYFVEGIDQDSLAGGPQPRSPRQTHREAT
jgi:hypothetical protein